MSSTRINSDHRFSVPGGWVMDAAERLANIPGLSRPSSTLYRAVGSVLHPNDTAPMELSAMMADITDAAPTARARRAFAGGYIKVAKGMLKEGEPEVMVLGSRLLDGIRNSPEAIADQAANICKWTSAPEIRKAAAAVMGLIVAEHAVNAPDEVGQWARHAGSHLSKRNSSGPG